MFVYFNDTTSLEYFLICRPRENSKVFGWCEILLESRFRVVHADADAHQRASRNENQLFILY